MRKRSILVLLLTVPSLLWAADKPPEKTSTPPLTITAEGLDKDGFILPDYAFCVPAHNGHVQEGSDKSIGLSWSPGPHGTKSYAILAIDTDVPTVFDDAGKEGKTLPVDMKRRDFYHWVLYDIPASKTAIPAYTDSQAVVKNGKSVLQTPYGVRGVNDYAGYFASDPERKGIYAGYDGPCPPWNDERIHHYHFHVYALDVSSLAVTSPATGPEVMKALTPHIIAQGEIVGFYTLNPALKNVSY